MKNKLTFSEYERMVENLGNIGFMPNGFWPTMEEIKRDIEPNIRKNLPFLIWLVECNPTANSSDKNKEVSKYINRLINANLELVYD